MQPLRVGPYTVLQVLGSGTLGRVLLARTDKGTRVAVKLFRPELAAYRGFGERLRVEVDAAARVRGPRVAAVLDADPDGEAPWLATEYVAAPPLHEVLARQGALDPAQIRRLGAGLAEALTSIHAAGTVHGDLKPGNVLLGPDGPHVTDVGVARAAAATPLTRGGALVGTVGYLAPEQVVDGRAGPASDVFALGSVLLLAATWRRPFGDGDAVAVLHRVLRGWADLRGVPGETAALIRACLHPNPGGRPAPEHVRAALSPGGHVGALGRAAPPLVTSTGSTAGVMPAAPQAVEPTTPRRTFSRGHRLAATTAVTAMLAGVLVVATADTIAVPPPQPPFAGLLR